MLCEETVLSIRLWSLQLPKTSNGKKVRQFFCCFKDSIENSDILTMQRVFNVALNQRQVQNAGHRSQVRAQGTGHRAQVTGHRAQGTGHRAQVTGHRAQGTGHRSQKTQ